MSLSVEESYKLLDISPSAGDEEITKKFRLLALKYHPDKNRSKIEWANNIMSRLNQAYSVIMSSRFESNAEDKINAEEVLRRKQNEERSKDMARQKLKELIREKLIADFVVIREEVKDSLYRYFQFNLDNIIKRESVLNKQTFNEVVKTIRYKYHSITALSEKTDDEELLEHFKVFKKMIFSFYRASECLNILDSYSNVIDVEAYRLYIEGDRFLHLAQKEIFYERHNRGSFQKEASIENIIKAAYFFKSALTNYPESSWAVELDIKMEYADALLRYIDLFFNED